MTEEHVFVSALQQSTSNRYHNKLLNERKGLQVCPEEERIQLSQFFMLTRIGLGREQLLHIRQFYFLFFNVIL